MWWFKPTLKPLSWFPLGTSWRRPECCWRICGLGGWRWCRCLLRFPVTAWRMCGGSSGRLCAKGGSAQMYNLNLCPIFQLLIYNFGLILQVGISSFPQASLSINSELWTLSFLILCFLKEQGTLRKHLRRAKHSLLFATTFSQPSRSLGTLLCDTPTEKLPT